MSLFQPFRANAEGERPSQVGNQETAGTVEPDSPVVDAIRPASNPDASRVLVDISGQPLTEAVVPKPEAGSEIPADPSAEIVEKPVSPPESQIDETSPLPVGVVGDSVRPVESTKNVGAAQAVNGRELDPVISMMKGAEKGYGTKADGLLRMANGLTETAIGFQGGNQ